MGVVTDPGKVVKLLTSFSCCVGGVSIFVHVVCVYLFSFGALCHAPDSRRSSIQSTRCCIMLILRSIIHLVPGTCTYAQ